MDSAARGIVVTYQVRWSDLSWMYLGSWAVRMLVVPDLFLLLVAATPPYVNVLEPPWESWRLPELESGGVRLF